MLSENQVIFLLVSTFGSVAGLIYGPMVLEVIKGWLVGFKRGGHDDTDR